MPKTVISTERAPRAIGPYSQAIKIGDFLYTSGQIPLDPATGELLQGTIEIETQRVMDNLAAVLEAAGASWANVIKTTIFLTNLADFAAVNGVYGAHFPEAPPARSTVQVAALPKGARVEIELIAHLGALAQKRPFRASTIFPGASGLKPAPFCNALHSPQRVDHGQEEHPFCFAFFPRTAPGLRGSSNHGGDRRWRR